MADDWGARTVDDTSKRQLCEMMRYIQSESVAEHSVWDGRETSRTGDAVHRAQWQTSSSGRSRRDSTIVARSRVRRAAGIAERQVSSSGGHRRAAAIASWRTLFRGSCR